MNYHISENLFFFGKWFTVIFLSNPLWTPRLGLNIFTWRPTFIFLVRAPWGKTAWTWGTTVLFTTPPSGPMAWTSCRILDTMAKYCGKSVVRIRVILLVLRSSNWLISEIDLIKNEYRKAYNTGITLIKSEVTLNLRYQNNVVTICIEAIL